MRFFKLRSSEWLGLAFFAYIALISPWFAERPNLTVQPYVVLAAVAGLLALLASGEASKYAKAADIARDWVPLALTIVAFREMELFVPITFTHRFESHWIRWDHILLADWRLRPAIESLGAAIPAYLELCYCLVYATGPFCIAALYLFGRRRSINRFFLIYLAGTLGAYALFPYFPSQPPRLLYPGVDFPTIHTPLQTFNWWILRKGTIHSSVFPSAHVSSAFSAAWAMFLLVPERIRFNWGLLLYAASVSLATLYGRYHYAADVAAGFAVSLAAAAIYLVPGFKRPAGVFHP